MVTKPKRQGLATASAIDNDGTLVELIYDPARRSTALAVWHGEAFTLEATVDLDNGDRPGAVFARQQSDPK